MKRGLCWLVLLAWWLHAAASISVSLDAATVSLGEPVRVILTYNPTETHGMPDLKPLQADFILLGTEQSMSYTVINGQAQATGQWSILLQPKKTGILLIPSIAMGTQSSPPTQVTVNAATHGVVTSDTHTKTSPLADDVGTKLTATINNPTPYLHQEVLYTVQLLSRQPLMNVQYRHPHVEEAIVFPLGEGRQYQTTLSGVLYHVDEQNYAIFPQKSGPMVITPPSLQAVVYDDTPKHISLRAEALTIQVKQLPAHQSLKRWLPSKLVRVRETYDQTNTHLSQGTTLVRNITIQAQGLVAKLLPALTFESGTGFSAYAGKPETLNDLKQGELWGSTTQSISYVFTQPGVVHLPAVTVPWFNVKTEHLEMATLPAKDIQIIVKKTAKVEQSGFESHPASRKEALERHFNFDKWTLMHYGYGLLGVVIAMSIGWIVWLSKRHSHIPNAYRLLGDACRANDPMQAKAALLLWAAQYWPHATLLDISDIRKLIDDEALQQQLSILITVLYHPQPSVWQGEPLWQAIQAFHKPTSGRSSQRSPLPPINPKGNDS